MTGSCWKSRGQQTIRSRMCISCTRSSRACRRAWIESNRTGLNADTQRMGWEVTRSRYLKGFKHEVERELPDTVSGLTQCEAFYSSVYNICESLH